LNNPFFDPLPVSIEFLSFHPKESTLNTPVKFPSSAKMILSISVFIALKAVLAAVTVAGAKLVGL
jgi:hypothetical protein